MEPVVDFASQSVVMAWNQDRAVPPDVLSHDTRGGCPVPQSSTHPAQVPTRSERWCSEPWRVDIEDRKSPCGKARHEVLLVGPQGSIPIGCGSAHDPEGHRHEGGPPEPRDVRNQSPRIKPVPAQRIPASSPRGQTPACRKIQNLSPGSSVEKYLLTGTVCLFSDDGWDS